MKREYIKVIPFQAIKNIQNENNNKYRLLPLLWEGSYYYYCMYIDFVCKRLLLKALSQVQYQILYKELVKHDVRERSGCQLNIKFNQLREVSEVGNSQAANLSNNNLTNNSMLNLVKR